MNLYQSLSLLLPLVISLGLLSQRFTKLPTSIVMTLSSLTFSLAMMALMHCGHPQIASFATQLLHPIDFHSLLINGMLAFLLFAGAMHVNIADCKAEKWEIGILATLGTVASTLLIGLLTYLLLHALNIPIQLIHSLLFGALISPTDPIAVLALFKQLNAPRRLHVTIEAESLFNDGIGIVLFLSLYQLTYSDQAISLSHVALLFLQQAIGGIVYGIALGSLLNRLSRTLQDDNAKILLTLAAVIGGYPLAQHLGISGPLAMVTAGMLFGKEVAQDTHRKTLYAFWNVIDELLNAVLFFLVGLELILIKMTIWEGVIALLAIPLVLIARWITVGTPMALFKRSRQYNPLTTSIMVWGGLRGGLALALALSLPPIPYRHLILVMTYAVVVFSVVVQGLTMKPLLKYSTQS